MRASSIITLLGAALLLGSVAVPVAAQHDAHSNHKNQSAKAGEPGNPVKTSGAYRVELRVPAEGLYAEEEVDIEFRVTSGGRAVADAKTRALVTMPSMPGMPKQNAKTHKEGVAGDYGLVVFFPHGGEYNIAVTVTPPKAKPFTVSFRVAVKDPDTTTEKVAALLPYRVQVTSSPATPRAGQPADLTIQVLSRDTGKPVRSFEVVHEELMHFLVVSRDLSQFSHEHPAMTPAKDGTFRLRYTFPTGGEYRLFADVAPKGAGSQILMQPLQVDGPPQAGAALKPSSKPTAVAGGVRVAMKTPVSKLASGRSMPVAFSLTNAATGKPIRDLQPWLGAMAHLMLIHENGESFVHSHPDETDPRNGRNGTITFLCRLPRPGLYKGWVQFKRAGKIETAPFVVKAG